MCSINRLTALLSELGVKLDEYCTYCPTAARSKQEDVMYLRDYFK